MRDATRIAGLGGVVLFLFGIVSYALTGSFDLWTAVHVAGGGILVAIAVVVDLAGFRRQVTARGTRERLRVGVGAVLFVAVLASLNVVAARRPWRYDATENKIHTLSAKTLAALSGLAAPVELVAFSQQGDAGREDLAALLDRFAAASPKVTWKFVDPERDPQIADTLGVKRKGVLAARSGKEIAQASSTVSEGVDEGQVTSLVLRVTRPAARVLYAITGHGEASIDDTATGDGLGVLAQALKAENFQVKPLLLSTVDQVPEDARAVILAGPVKPLLDHEVDALRKYLAGGGRVLFLVDPGTDPGVAPILADYRLALGDDMVVDREEVPFLGARLGVDPLIQDFRPHPITKDFKERIVLLQARSVALRNEGGLPGADAQILAEASAAAWAEKDYRAMLSTGQVRPPKRDASAPRVAVAAAAKAHAGGDAVKEESRLVVVGDSDFVRNANLGAYFNREFVLNAVQWLSGSEDLIAEAPRGLRASRLDMSEADYRNLFRLSVLLLPEALLIVGIAVWWRRRTL